MSPYLVYDLTAKSLSHLAGRDRGAMAGAFRQEDVIWPFKDPKGGETLFDFLVVRQIVCSNPAHAYAAQSMLPRQAPEFPSPLCPMKELCYSLWSGKGHENCEVPKLFGARHRNFRRCLIAL